MGMAKSKGGGKGAAKAEKARNVARPFTPDALLKRSIRSHFTRLGFAKANDGTLVLPGVGKEIVRQLHGGQRAERLLVSSAFIERASAIALPHFANGAEIDPTKIQLKLIRVESGTEQSELFRFATLTWSVPVSVGFGRRLRYLVWDEAHDRLVGVMALGDPVFNLSVRDNLIEWDVHDRAKRLVNILDATFLAQFLPTTCCWVEKPSRVLSGHVRFSTISNASTATPSELYREKESAPNSLLLRPPRRWDVRPCTIACNWPACST
jgi:Domain of unknown function (DUF4338)